MPFRRLIAIAIFFASVFYGIQGIRLFSYHASGYERPVAALLCVMALIGIISALTMWSSQSSRLEEEESLWPIPSRAELPLSFLLMVFLGGASIFVAIKGIVTGSIPTPVQGNDNVFFEKSPGRFIALLALWSGFGGVFWLAAWRTVKQNKSDKRT